MQGQLCPELALPGGWRNEMWATVIELRRPKGFDVVREKLLGLARDDISITFGELGEITIGITNSAHGAADATKIALERFAFLMLAAKLVLEPYAIQTHPARMHTVPALAGTSEIADILGVKKPRASQLMKTSDFPRPVASLAMGPVYLAYQIRAFKGKRSERGMHGAAVSREASCPAPDVPS